ncbi:hypothetical protein KC722_01330, partial [Candidatus Kaiserbacteria bacterium]|nr:hypothetical protein [Candidatus Kaiserbacteria bacterium]
MEVLSRRHYTTIIKSFLLALLAAVFWCASTALAADVVLSPASGSYSQNQTFTVTVQAVPNGDSINAVEAEMTFDQSKLSVV